MRRTVAVRRETRPRPGLSVPVVTVLDDAMASSPRRTSAPSCASSSRAGHGADVVFAAGTTGEWDRVANSVRQRVIQVCAEEVAKANARSARTTGARRRGLGGHHGPHRRRDAREPRLRHRPERTPRCSRPLSIQGIDDPVRFVARDVADLLDARSRRIPVYLYDNADIAVDPKVPHIRTRQVKALSRLDFVRGIKVSARARCSATTPRRRRASASGASSASTSATRC